MIPASLLFPFHILQAANLELKSPLKKKDIFQYVYIEYFTSVAIITLNYWIFLLSLVFSGLYFVLYFIYSTSLDSFTDYNHFFSITTSLMKN